MMEKCVWASLLINYMSLWMNNRAACNKLASTYSKKIQYVVVSQTVWEDVRAYQVITKVTSPDVHEKLLLGFLRDSAVGIAFRLKCVHCAC